MQDGETNEDFRRWLAIDYPTAVQHLDEADKWLSAAVDRRAVSGHSAGGLYDMNLGFLRTAFNELHDGIALADQRSYAQGVADLTYVCDGIGRLRVDSSPLLKA